MVSKSTKPLSQVQNALLSFGIVSEITTLGKKAYLVSIDFELKKKYRQRRSAKRYLAKYLIGVIREKTKTW